MLESIGLESIVEPLGVDPLGRGQPLNCHPKSHSDNAFVTSEKRTTYTLIHLPIACVASEKMTASLYKGGTVPNSRGSIH